MGKKGKRKGVEEVAAKRKRAVDKATQREVVALCHNIFEVAKLEPPTLPAQQWEEHLKLREMVEVIRKKQTGLPMIDSTRDSREEQIPNFIKWFMQHGGLAEKVTIARFDGQGLGLKALADIKAGEMFCRVPKKVTLTTETAIASEIGPLIQTDPILRLMQNTSLAFHVLCERAKDDSFWKPYLDVLPSSYTTPLYYSADELQNLKGSPAFGEALKLYRNIARQYAHIFRLVQSYPEAAKLPFSHFTFDDHRWAVSTIMTRLNRIPSAEGQSTLALIPMWDMCNHCNGEVTTGFNLELQSCDSAAVRDFAAGEQVLIFYGERSNAHFLVHNGFVFPGNVCDQVNIQLGISRRDPLYALKEAALKATGLTASNHPYPVLYGDFPVCRELHVFLQVFSMTQDELEDLLRQDPVAMHGKLGWSGVAITQGNECRSWEFLETRLSLLLTQYKTSPQEDEELIRSPETAEHTRLCVQLRMTEREILANALSYARKMKAEVKEAPNRGSDEASVPERGNESEQRADEAQSSELVEEVNESMKDVTIRDQVMSPGQGE